MGVLGAPAPFPTSARDAIAFRSGGCVPLESSPIQGSTPDSSVLGMADGSATAAKLRGYEMQRLPLGQYGRARSARFGQRHYTAFWLGKKGSDLRIRDSKSRALPLGHSPTPETLYSIRANAAIGIILFFPRQWKIYHFQKEASEHLVSFKRRTEC
jgi:hypothetical protein